MTYNYKIKEEKGYSKYFPGNKTPGLTPDVLNTILKRIATEDKPDEEKKNIKGEVNEEGEGMSTSDGAGGYLGKYAFKLPKKQKKIGEAKSPSSKPKSNNPGATLGPGPPAGDKGVINNAYIKQFKYKLVK